MAERLKRLRTAAGLTQKQLAKNAGVSLSYVTQIEQGVILNPRVATARKLAKALSATLDELVGPEGES